MMYNGYRYCNPQEALDVFNEWVDSPYGRYFIESYLSDDLYYAALVQGITDANVMYDWFCDSRDVAAGIFFSEENIPQNPTKEEFATYVVDHFSTRSFEDYNRVYARYRFMASFASFTQVKSFCYRCVSPDKVYLESELKQIRDNVDYLDTLAYGLRAIAKQYSLAATLFNLHYGKLMSVYNSTDESNRRSELIKCIISLFK